MGAFGTRVVVVAGPEATQEALTNKAKAFSQNGWDYFIGAVLQPRPDAADFEEHHLHRRIMQEAFTRDRLDGYVRAARRRSSTSRCRGWPTDEPFRVYPALKDR